MFYDVAFDPIKIETHHLAPQNDHQHLSFVKDVVVGEKMTRNGQKMAKRKGCFFWIESGVENSCRNFFKLTGSESHTLERLNKLIGEDTLAFVRAKEDFKRNKNSPGILYSDVIRQSFKSVPYFHYAEDSR